jgi:hypothetical protein
MAKIVNSNVSKSTTIKFNKKTDTDFIGHEVTFARVDVTLLASVDDITKNKYDS